MARRAISHRKRTSTWAGVVALLVAGAGLVAATLLAPVNAPAPSAPRVERIAAAPAIAPPISPELQEVDVALDLAGLPPASAPHRRARNGVPLDARIDGQPDGFEVLSAAELDAISQARH
jgi:hypothetical protein